MLRRRTAIARDMLMSWSMAVAVTTGRLVGNRSMADRLGVGDMSISVCAGAMVSA